MDYIVVGYYTENTGYAKESENLIKSLEQFNLPFDVIPTPNQGSWQANTQYKAYFIKQMLLRHYPKNILYLDVDAVVKKQPILFDSFQNYDFGVHYRDNVELISSTVYFANNAKVSVLVDRWVDACIKNPTIWDQKVLQAVINKSQDLKLRVVNLPPQYCKIFDVLSVKDPVIEQFQASRRLRGEIDHRAK